MKLPRRKAVEDSIGRRRNLTLPREGCMIQLASWSLCNTVCRSRASILLKGHFRLYTSNVDSSCLERYMFPRRF